MAQIPDPDDIFRQIDLENPAECSAEFNRLLKKRKPFKATFTTAYNILVNHIAAARGENGQFDRSVVTMNALRCAKETLELRYSRLEKCLSRMMELTDVEDTSNTLEKELDKYSGKHVQAIQMMGNLMISMSSQQPAQAAQGVGPVQSLRLSN